MNVRISTATLKYVILLAPCLVIGTTWHEIVGHGLVGVCCGGRIEWVKLLGFRVWPDVRWDGWEGYGACEVTGIGSRRGERVMELAGSLSTWCVAVAAIGLLWLRGWRGWPRVLLVYLGLWWIDLFTYTLPTWGVRRSILWGAMYSEPYQAATALGMPGRLFQALVVLTSAGLATALSVRILRDRRAAAVPLPSVSEARSVSG